MAYEWPTNGKAEPRMIRFGACGFDMITVKIGSRPLGKEGSTESFSSFHPQFDFAILRHFVAEWLRP